MFVYELCREMECPRDNPLSACLTAELQTKQTIVSHETAARRHRSGTVGISVGPHWQTAVAGGPDDFQVAHTSMVFTVR